MAILIQENGLIMNLTGLVFMNMPQRKLYIKEIGLVDFKMGMGIINVHNSLIMGNGKKAGWTEMEYLHLEMAIDIKVLSMKI